MCGILLACLIGAVAVHALYGDKKNIIAFYRIEREDVLALQKIVKKVGERQNVCYEFLTLDPAQSLVLQKNIARHAKMIFVPSGFALETALDELCDSGFNAKSFISDSDSMIAPLIYSESGKKVEAVPVLSDFLLLEFNLASLLKTGNHSINSWKDVEMLASSLRGSSKSAVGFAGGDGVFLLDLLGAIAESIDGVEVYERAAKILKAQASVTPFSAEKLIASLADAEDAPLKSAVDMLKKWRKSGFIGDPVFETKISDSSYNEKLFPLSFISLSDRRKLGTISDFSSIYLPSKLTAPSRHFAAQAVYAVPIQPSSRICEVVREFMIAKNQEELSASTGFAPIVKNCQNMDRQIDDVCYWLSSTGKQNCGLGREAYFSNAQLESVRAEILKRIK